MNSDKYKNENFEFKSIFRGIKDWRIRYECIENGCSRLDSLSVKHLGCWKELEGNQQVELKYGYKAILDSMINKTDSEKFYSKLKLKHSLSRILLCENLFNDEKSANDSCEHCLYTCTMSLGYLKENFNKIFFNHSNKILFSEKFLSIKKLGYGTVNKVCLFFSHVTPPN